MSEGTGGVDTSIFAEGRKSVLVVLFVPSVERDGRSPIDRDRWVEAAPEMFGRVFAGATAYPKPRDIWRDDGRGGALIKDEPVVRHCYTTPEEVENEGNLAQWVASVVGWDVILSSLIGETDRFPNVRRLEASEGLVYFDIR